ncbi:hypothetical protein [Azospirillum doebereinerae]|uniref:Uncharacterized protein n=1 Tax=Azospirillum doebereinerae TaxID=92933 RepID=A0A3S0WR97_9PROT|nr:hypothetical protein [Azospirillum doebereinerae]RUQ64008.1 hypothetical protein EJ913_27180 [Azospirillum doebereinerae]
MHIMGDNGRATPALSRTNLDITGKGASLPRRAVLAVGVAALPLIAAVPGAPSTGTGDPDAALLRAWADYLTACRTMDRLPSGLSEEAYDPTLRLIREATDGLLSIPASTPRGVAVKLRWLWHRMLESREARAVIVHGLPMPDALLEDSRSRLVWDLIGEAERMGAVA